MKQFKWLVPSLSMLVISYLVLPEIFFSNFLLWFVSSAVILVAGIKLFRNIEPKSPRLIPMYHVALILLTLFTFIALLNVNFPFWLQAPEHYCTNQRVKAPICAFESEVGRADDELLPVYIVGHSWHTGLMFRTEDIPDNMLKDIGLNDLDLVETPAVEIGWGDEGFYRATNYTIWLGMKALLIPTPSVLHVVKLPKSAAENFPYSDIYIYWATANEFERLLSFVANSFSKNDFGLTEDLGKGIYGNSQFFRANGTFHFPKSCNSWVAKALVSAGAPIWPNVAFTARNTLHQVELVGEIVRKTPGFKLLPN